MLRPFLRLSFLLSVVLHLSSSAIAREAHTGIPSTTLTIHGAVEKRLVLTKAVIIAPVSTGGISGGASHFQGLQANGVRKIVR